MSNHPGRRLVVALSVLAMIPGVVFIPTLFAQRVAPTPQDGPLKTVTLSGKVEGFNRGTDPRAGRSPYSRTGSRPQPLSEAQRAILFKGRARAATKSFTLTPRQATLSDKARIYFLNAEMVVPLEIADYAEYGGHVQFDGGSTPRLVFRFKGKAGQLYALDISVGHWVGANAIYTLSNTNVPGATQTIPNSDGGDLHLTAYVTPEQDGELNYELQCSRHWAFYSIEVTEL